MSTRMRPSQPIAMPLDAFVARDGVRPEGVRTDGVPARVGDHFADYSLLDVPAGRHRFLDDLFEGFGCATLHAWVERERLARGFDRVSADGLVTGLVECDGRTVAVAWSDFRVRAGSYGRANATRLAAFLRWLRERPEPIPLVYMIESAGFSLMEGRTAFTDVFNLWPELLRYAEERPVFTCARGRCLGLAPILFGLGHYRIAVADRTQINLTGPEVIKLFFGTGVDFDERAAAERSTEHHDLVHELVPSVRDALARFRGLLAVATPASPAAATPAAPDDEAAWPDLDARTAPLVRALFDAPPVEVVPGICPRLRLLVGMRGGRPLGALVNPLARSNNMITARTLEKYGAGLDLFRALRLPIVSVLDSPGIDPRFEECDAGLVRKILAVGERIIRYPYGTLGVIAGRCYGGATSLGFPKVFGGSRVVALRGAQFGVMHERIVDQVLSGSPRLLAQWREVASGQREDLADLLAEGLLDAVIDPAELPAEVERFLAYAASRLPTSRRSVSGQAAYAGRTHARARGAAGER